MKFKEGYSDRFAEVPCGYCIECRLKKKRDWAIRACHEARLSEDSRGVERSCFITLTYSDEHLPDDRSVDVTHWQKFAKRLRKRMGSFRFLHCGEYGDQTRRPHYHALLFGIDFSHDRRPWETTAAGHQTWVSDTLEETWGMGHCYIGQCSFDSAAYTAGYTVKKIYGPMAEQHYERYNEHGEVWSVRPDYATMSRRPGLGARYFDRYLQDIYPSDSVVIDGRVMKPPAYYDNLLKEREPDLYDYVMAERLKNVKPSDSTWERRLVREKVKSAEFAIKQNGGKN